MKVGFAGLGSMGLPMASNLLKGGHSLIVWNRSARLAEPLAASGATVAQNALELADVDVLISMLADDQAVEDVILTTGLLEQLAPGAIHINMATVSVAFAQRMTALHLAHGIGYVAAPVLGRVDVAAAGNLNILAAGPQALLDRVQPLFDLMGQKTWRYGDDPAQANAVKIAANFSIACAIETMGEGAALMKAHGIEPESFIELLTSTLFPSPVYKGYGAMIAKEQYSPAGFKLSLGLKDVKLALAAGEAHGLALPFASVLRDAHLEAVAHGDGQADWAALAKVAARRGNLG